MPVDWALVFPGRGGGPWGDDAWRYWRRRVYAPAAKAAGLPSPVRPYDLRHSFVSLLLAEGANVVEIARQAGHSPTMTLSTYAHLFDEAAGAERVSAEDEIRRARQLVRRERRTRPIRTRSGDCAPALGRRRACKSRRADARTRTGDPFITSEVLYQLSYVGEAV